MKFDWSDTKISFGAYALLEGVSEDTIDRRAKAGQLGTVSLPPGRSRPRLLDLAELEKRRGPIPTERLVEVLRQHYSTLRQMNDPLAHLFAPSPQARDTDANSSTATPPIGTDTGMLLQQEHPDSDPVSPNR